MTRWASIYGGITDPQLESKLSQQLLASYLPPPGLLSFEVPIESLRFSTVMIHRLCANTHQFLSQKMLSAESSGDNLRL